MKHTVPGDFRLNTRCTHFASELYDVQRYVDGLLALSPDDPDWQSYCPNSGTLTVLQARWPEGRA